MMDRAPSLVTCMLQSAMKNACVVVKKWFEE